MGVSTTNTLERTMASFGQIKGMSPDFKAHNSVEFEGVLFLLPTLLQQGLIKTKDTHMIAFEIIPSLISTNIIAAATEHTTSPVCTLIFDREAYELAFFIRLWTVYKIAIILYRKFVKDQ
jgi:hypothetical protein